MRAIDLALTLRGRTLNLRDLTPHSLGLSDLDVYLAGRSFLQPVPERCSERNDRSPPRLRKILYPVKFYWSVRIHKIWRSGNYRHPYNPEHPCSEREDSNEPREHE